jgi:hypothetical protein
MPRSKPPVVMARARTSRTGAASACPQYRVVTRDAGSARSAAVAQQRSHSWVQIDLEKDSHMISPEERYRVAMARQ